MDPPGNEILGSVEPSPPPSQDGRKKPRTEKQKQQFQRLLEIMSEKRRLQKENKEKPPAPPAPSFLDSVPPPPPPEAYNMSSIRDMPPPDTLDPKELFRVNSTLWSTFIKEKDAENARLREENKKLMKKYKRRAYKDPASEPESDEEKSEDSDSDAEESRSSRRRAPKGGLKHSIRHILKKELRALQQTEGQRWAPTNRTIDQYALPQTFANPYGAYPVERESLAGTLNSPYLPEPPRAGPYQHIPAQLQAQNGALAAPRGVPQQQPRAAPPSLAQLSAR